MTYRPVLLTCALFLTIAPCAGAEGGAAPVEFSADTLSAFAEALSPPDLAAILLDAPRYFPAFLHDPHAGWPVINFKSDPTLAAFLAREAFRLVRGGGATDFTSRGGDGGGGVAHRDIISADL